MKFGVRTIKNRQAELDIDVTDTSLVSELLERVVEEFKPEYQFDSTVLVHKGKPLDPAKPLAEYKIKENDKIVVMKQKKVEVWRAKVPPAAAVGEGQVEGDNAETGEKTATSTVTTSATTTTTTTQQEDGTVTISTKIDNLSVTQDGEEIVAKETSPSTAGDKYPEQREYLRKLGFEDEEISQALDKTGGDSDAAVMHMVQKVTDGEVDDHDEIGEDHPLYHLINSEVFEQMKEQVKTDPSALAEYLVAMAQSNPLLAEAVVQYEEVLLRHLLGSSPTPASGAASQHRPQVISIQLTAADEASIARLQELGFDRNRCIEAYLACDKHEELAANFLFEEED